MRAFLFVLDSNDCFTPLKAAYGRERGEHRIVAIDNLAAVVVAEPLLQDQFEQQTTFALAATRIALQGNGLDLIEAAITRDNFHIGFS